MMRLGLLFSLHVLVAGTHSRPDPCTKEGRFCVHAATCNKLSMTCRCPAHHYGDGLLDCVRNGHGHCEITRDPRIMQFPGARGSLYFPCRHNLAKFASGHSPKACQTHVFGTSELVSFGRYFENEVEIELSVGNKLPSVFEALDTLYFRANENGTWRTSNKNGFKSNGNDFEYAPWGHGFHVTLAGVSISVSFDVDNVMTFAVAECNTRIKFRPYTRDERPQKRIPGVSIVSPLHASFHDPSYQFPHVLCATPHDSKNHMVEPAKSLDLSIDEYLMYVMMNNAPEQLRGAYKHECSLVCALYKGDCPEERKAKAIRTCFPLLALDKTISCIFAIPSGFNPMDLFHKCVQHVCLDNFAACQTFKNVLTSCPLPKSLRNLDCGSPGTV